MITSLTGKVKRDLKAEKLVNCAFKQFAEQSKKRTLLATDTEPMPSVCSAIKMVVTLKSRMQETRKHISLTCIHVSDKMLESNQTPNQKKILPPNY